MFVRHSFGCKQAITGLIYDTWSMAREENNVNRPHNAFTITQELLNAGQVHVGSHWLTWTPFAMQWNIQGVVSAWFFLWHPENVAQESQLAWSYAFDKRFTTGDRNACSCVNRINMFIIFRVHRGKPHCLQVGLIQALLIHIKPHQCSYFGREENWRTWWKNARSRDKKQQETQLVLCMKPSPGFDSGLLW